ncbi:phosphotransferase enzyme family protein [uncultured Muribaculum sp.]|uniref:phosphotransferase enzyme family protein n=1 Tax=uncultured Muribaculum sp. TaxID=1918613 RepID=UPI0025D05979|nr:aminoglycoside phosphotransferase family protein [uncultured Muribaculum sp.]
MADFNGIVARFATEGTVGSVKPLGNGLINDTYVVRTEEADMPDYVLQRINHHIFTDVDVLQSNIEAVTAHIRRKLEESGADDIDRKVLRFIPVRGGGKTYHFDGESYWRMMAFIPGAHTLEAVTPESSRDAGRAFGEFQAMLVDMDADLKESIPDFHNMELRLRQLREAVALDKAGRVEGVRDILEEIESRADEMCLAERLHREGKLPKRICHCDTKVNNMMFDEHGQVLCVIDLDTVMPSYVFSDYGDFLRTGANKGDEDDRDLSRVEFDMDIFRAFTEGYLSSARTFLTPVEIDNLPYAAAMFPYMQAVRFLADYINGDTYYKIQYPDHNLVRTRAQMKLLHSVDRHTPEMRAFIASVAGA